MPKVFYDRKSVQPIKYADTDVSVKKVENLLRAWLAFRLEETIGGSDVTYLNDRGCDLANKTTMGVNFLKVNFWACLNFLKSQINFFWLIFRWGIHFF